MSFLRLGRFTAWAALVLTGSAAAGAAPPQPIDPPASSWAISRSLHEHFGAEDARRMMESRAGEASPEAVEQTLLGIDRASGLATPEALGLLVHAVQDPHGIARAHPTLWLAATRALSAHADQPAVARVLTEIVQGGGLSRTSHGSPTGDPRVHEGGAVDLARETAAVALAMTREDRARERLAAAARQTGPSQRAALLAVLLAPPVRLEESPSLTLASIAFLAALEDPRAADTLLSATRSLEPDVRAAALLGLARLGDVRAVAAAQAVLDDRQPAVRAAAATVLVDLGVPDAAEAVRHLIEDDATAADGVKLGARTTGAAVVGALAARAKVATSLALRRASLAALGHHRDATALEALGAFLSDPALATDAAEAIARSPAPTAWSAVETLLAAPASRRLGARMAAVRGRLLGGVPPVVTRSLEALARSGESADRAVAASALVLLSRGAIEAWLSDRDPAVRRVAAMACPPFDPACGAALLSHLSREADPATRIVLSGGLLSAESDHLSSSDLALRLEAADIDAPAALAALARRPDDDTWGLVGKGLRSTDPILRAHAAYGLASSSRPSAVGELCHAYTTELDPAVRRAIVVALAARREDASAPLRAITLARAATLDPEGLIRAVASRARRGLATTTQDSSHETLWLHAMSVSGAPAPGLRGIVVGEDGLAVPVVFDADGQALVPRSPGAARLLLANGPD